MWLHSSHICFNITRILTQQGIHAYLYKYINRVGGNEILITSLYFSNWQAHKAHTNHRTGRTIKVGKDIRSSSLQLPAQVRVNCEFTPGCSGLCPFRCWKCALGYLHHTWLSSRVKKIFLTSRTSLFFFFFQFMRIGFLVLTIHCCTDPTLLLKGLP